MTKTVLLLSFVLFVFSVFADCDTCSAYKTQVVNDCTAINNSLSVTIAYVEDVKSQSNYLVGYLKSSDFVSQNKYNNTITELNTMSQNLTQIRGRLETSQTYLTSIKNTAQSLVCVTNSTGSCECAPLLEDLIDDLADLSTEVHNIYVSEINQEGLLYQIYYNLSLALTELRNIDSNISSFTNSFDSVITILSDSYDILMDADGILSGISSKLTTIYNVFNTNFWQFRDSHLTANQTFWSTSQYHFLRYNGTADQAKSVMQTAIVADDFLKWIAQSLPLSLTSLNNYHYANWTNNAVVNHYLDNLQDYVSGTPELLTNIVDTLHFIASSTSNRLDNSSFHGFFTNVTVSSNSNWAFDNVATRLLFAIGGDDTLDLVQFDTLSSGYYNTAVKAAVERMSFKDMVINFSKGHFRLLSSLNNYLYSFYKEISGFSNTVSKIERKFSLFTSSLYDSDTPLKYYDGNGSYHDYLTNYYIRLSEGQQSGTETFTNWFNRIEILLAALVFQDSPAGTNEFSDSAVSTSTIDQSKQQADNSINQVLQSSSSYTEIVNTSGQSIINMVSTWDSCLKNVSKPAPFAICEFGYHDSASEKDYFMFPMDNEIISSLVDIGHGISTICWITAFLFLGYAFSRWVISKLAMMISFAYDIYTAIFGGK